MGRNPVGKVEERLEELLLAFPVKLNGHERICTTDDSQQRQHKDARQRMLTRSFDARVRNTLKVLKNRLCREFVLHVTCPLASPARNPVARDHTNDARSRVSSNRSKLLHVWRDSPGVNPLAFRRRLQEVCGTLGCREAVSPWSSYRLSVPLPLRFHPKVPQTGIARRGGGEAARVDSGDM